MPITLTINGTPFEYPTNRDQGWGTDASGWASAVSVGMLQKAAGLFQITAELDFGTAFGLKSLYYKSRTTNPSSTGQIRLARADTINWRNQANSANLALGLNSSNHLTFDGDFGVFTDAFATSVQDGYTILWNQSLGNFQVKPVPATGGGITTVGTIDSQTKSTNGLVITGSSIFAQTADLTRPGQVSTGTQSFIGNKTFQGNTAFSDATSTRLTITPGGTSCPIEWAQDINSPILDQETSTTPSVTAHPLTIKAQTNSGAGSVGGALRLSSGGGTGVGGRDGYINFQIDSNTKASLQPSRLYLSLEQFPLVIEGSNAFLDGAAGTINGDDGGFFTASLNGLAYPFFSTSVIQGSGFYKRTPLQYCVASKKAGDVVTAAISELNCTGTFAVPANVLQIGSTFRIKYSFRFNRGATTTALSFTAGVSFFGTVFAGTFIASSTAPGFEGYVDVDAIVSVRSIGASGTKTIYIKTTSNVAASNAFGYTAFDNDLTTINTTANNIIYGSASMSAAVAATTITCMGGSVEWLNVED